MGYQVEQKWIEYWNDLYDIMAKFDSPVLLDENFTKISLDDAQHKIQNDVYDGKSIEFSEVYYQGKKAIMIKKI